MAHTEDARPGDGSGGQGRPPEGGAAGGGDLEFDEAQAGAGAGQTGPERPAGDERPVYEDPNDR